MSQSLYFLLIFIAIGFVRCQGENPFVSRIQQGLWCLRQWNTTNNLSQQLGQAFFYPNETFTINFLDEINSTWINQIDTIHSLVPSTTYVLMMQTSTRRNTNGSLSSPFKWCSWYHFQTNGNLLWRDCSSTSSSMNIYTRSSSNCSFVDDENPTQILSNTPYERSLLRFDQSINESRGSPMVFYGSSSIRMWWNLSQDFSNISDNVINRGFGGSTLKQCLQQFKRLILPLNPRWLFIYAGENDITDGEIPQNIHETFQQLMEIIRRFYPNIPVFYISIKPSPSRWSKVNEMNETNRLIRDTIQTMTNVHFIDIFNQMLTNDGLPRQELFLADNLHMNERGYAIWTEEILNYLQKRTDPSISNRSSNDQISMLILCVNISFLYFFRTLLIKE